MRSNALKRSWRWLARPGVLAVLIVALLGVLLVGTLLPQLPEAAPEANQLSEWRALARTRYGSLTPILEALGAYRIYRTPFLWVPLALLAAATLACIFQRGPKYWRAAFNQPVRIPETLLDGVSHATILEPSPADEPALFDRLPDIARRTLQARDYRVRAEVEPDRVWLRGDRNRLSPLGTIAEHLALLAILGGIGLSVLLGWRETFVIEPGQAVEIGHATGILLRNNGFEIQRYGDGSPAAYTAQVTIERDGEIGHRKIGVNQSTAERGIRFYLEGYSTVEAGHAVTLLAVHDPGFGVVVGGALLLLAGLVVALYFPRSSVLIRVTRADAARLSGWADPRAYDFDREFARLSADLRQQVDRQRGASPRSGTL